MDQPEKTVTSQRKEFYSLEEVADLLSVNYQLIYKLVRLGELPAVRIGKGYRVSRADLDTYLNRSKAQAGGRICAVCGNTYQSRLSLKHSCVECGDPICIDCWSRRKVRTCPAHGSSRPPAASDDGKTQTN